MKSLLALKLSQVTSVLPAKSTVDSGNEAVNLKEESKLAKGETAMKDNYAPATIDSDDVEAFVMVALQSPDIGDGSESDQSPLGLHDETQ